jgi:predicted secreted acid phosphatase
MFKRAYLASLAAGLAVTFLSCPARAEEPANLTAAKQAVNYYVQSGEYAKDVATVALRANKYLARRIPKGAKPGKKLAVVFDIDDTTLTNLSHMAANDYGYVPAVWNAWVAEAHARAIIPVQTVYDTAIRGKIDVIFITGRPETQRAATEHNLRDVGYDTWARIYFKPTTDVMLTNLGFKIDVRRKLTQEGYTIIANIGDQDSDLAGGYAERTFKLPNPFYLAK